MLTTIIASNFTTITISGNALEQYMSNSPKTGTLKLEVYNCSSASPAVIIDLTQTIATPKTINGTVGSYNYIVTLSDLNMTTVITNGVYNFKLKYVDTTSYEDTSIVYINKDIACKLINYYADFGLKDCELKKCSENEYFFPYMFDDLLQRANSCNDFTFDNACMLYNTMITLLDTTKLNDCGCKE